VARADNTITIITPVTDTPAVDAVVAGPGGLLEVLRPGHSTVCNDGALDPAALIRVLETSENDPRLRLPIDVERARLTVSLAPLTFSIEAARLNLRRESEASLVRFRTP